MANWEVGMANWARKSVSTGYGLSKWAGTGLLSRVHRKNGRNLCWPTGRVVLSMVAGAKDYRRPRVTCRPGSHTGT